MILSNPIEQRNIIGYVAAIVSSVESIERRYESARRGWNIGYAVLFLRVGYGQREGRFHMRRSL
jgi:hypothetical protein